MQALTEAKANDLLFWASRYHLFVHWSANRAHPWDNMPKSEAACAILEIGKLRNSDGEVSCTFTYLLCFTCQPVCDPEPDKLQLKVWENEELCNFTIGASTDCKNVCNGYALHTARVTPENHRD